MSSKATRASDKLSLTMATIIGVNAIVGAGIFGVPAKLQIAAGPAGLLTYAFIIMAVLFMALSFARVATLYPEEGAFYSYAKVWGGHTWGVLAMLSYLTGLIVAMGLLARIAGSYIHIYIPNLSLLTTSIAILALLVIANLAGAVLSKIGQIILIILTYIPLIIITSLCLTQTNIENLTPFAPEGLSGIFSAIPAVIFGFFGFESIPALFRLIQDPEKNVPKAVTWTIILVGLTYIIFTGSIILGLPRVLFTSVNMPLSEALLAVFPQYTWLVSTINWAIIVTIMGTIHAMIWSISSMVFDASNKIQSLKGSLTPRSSLLILGSSTILSCIIFTSIDLMFSLTALFIVFAYAAAILPLLIKPKGRSFYQIGIAVGGLMTAAIIFFCGVYGTIMALA